MKTAIQRLLPVALLTIALHQPATARTGNETPEKTITPAQHSMQQGIPFAFIENAGQITDQHNRERKDIDYKLTVPGMDIYVGHGEIHYQWSREVRKAESGKRILGSAGWRAESAEPETVPVELYRMDVVLLGSNKHVVPVAEEPQSYYESHYNELHPDGVRAQSCARIVYRNVYPNIDWVLYTRNSELKYDFVVRPGGNPALIRLQYKGATRLELKDGALTATTPMGSITEQAPYSYEAATGKAIASAYRLDGDVLSFDVAKAKGGIVIDPALAWATYYGGPADEIYQSKGITTDASGNVYIAASTENTTNMATTGAHQTTMSNSNSNGLIVKFNSSGVRQWGTYYGGNSHDELTDIVYSSSAIYVVGGTYSTTGMATAGAFQTTLSSAGANVILAKFDLNGSRQWATYYGDGARMGINVEIGAMLAADASGNVYLPTASNVAATAGAHRTMAVRGDAMLTKFSPSGSRLWATYFGGDSIDVGFLVACDGSGNVYLSGVTRSFNGIATTGAHKLARSAPYYGSDPFLAKFSSSGSLLWATYYGDGGEGSSAMAADDNGNVYLGGQTLGGGSNIATAGSYWPTHTAVGTYNGYLIKFNSSGVRQWGTYFSRDIHDIAIGAQNNVYLTGMYDINTGMPITTAGAWLTSLPFSQGGHYAIFNGNGNLLYGTYFAGNIYDEAFSINTGPNGNTVHLVGRAGSTSGLATTGAHQTTHGGANWDLFIAKFQGDTSLYLNLPFKDTLLCTDTIIQVPYSVTSAFNSGNVFSVQLSNTSGSFTSPTTIGTATATGSGSISCNVPIGTLAGTGYRIRIVSSSPVRTSNENGNTIEFISRPNILASSNTPLCSGNTLNLSTALGPTSTSYAWTGPNGFSSLNASPSITNVTSANAGTYILQANNLGCKKTSSVTVTVNPTPATPTASVVQPICKGGVIALSAASDPGTTYQWSGPLGYSSTQQNPSISPAALNMSGMYTVVATLGNCPSAPASVNVVVNKVADIGAYASPDDTICNGELLTLVGFPQNGGPSPIFAWYMNGTQVTTNKIYTTTTAVTGDKFWCTMVATGLCPTPLTLSTDTITITVLNIKYTPKVKITATPGVTGDPAQLIEFKANVQYGGISPTYQWYKNGVKLPGSTGSSATLTTTGIRIGDEISVQIVSNHACADVTTAADTVRVQFPAGVKDNDKNTTVSQYPNPNRGSFTIDGVSGREVKLSIVNVLGQVVYSDARVDVKGSVSVDASLAPGAYLLRMIGDGVSYSLRFNVVAH